MTTATLAVRKGLGTVSLGWTLAPRFIAGLAFLVLFWTPLAMLIRDWWSNPDAGHGLLLAPLAIYLAWKRGLIAEPKAQHDLGIAMLVLAVLARYVSGLAVEWFTMRMSML